MSNYDCELDLTSRNSLSVLIDRIKQNSTVLEFGPANGRMTKHLKEKLNCKVYCVEIDVDAAKDASSYAEEMFVGSIEDYNWQEKFKAIEFDYIVFADVLEHLYYPEKVLKSVREFLREDGSILVSIPNIAHNAIVLGLLKNEFNYHPTGLLDNTHIRFFTQKTFDNLIIKSGYYKAYETAIFIEPQNTEFAYKYRDVPELFANYLREQSWGEIYQIIFEMKKYETKCVSDFKEDYRKSSRYFNQLYIDNGNGYTEDNSIKISFDFQSSIQFNLSTKSNVKSLRFDPLNDYCIIKINNIKINDEIYINHINSNAFYYESGIYYFDTNDSQMYLDISKFKYPENITFELEYLYTGDDTRSHFSDIYTEILEKKSEEIKELNEDVNQKSEEIKELNEDVNQKSEEIKELNEDVNQKSEEIKELNEDVNQKSEEIYSIKDEYTELYMSKANKIMRFISKIIGT